MTRIHAQLVLLGVLGALAPGCADREKELSNLDGREFLSESVEGQTLVAGTRIRMSFEDSAINVNAGCNHLFGDYQIEGGALLIGGLGGTAIGCPGELHAQDTWITDLLTERPAIELDGARLTLRGGGVEVVLLDRELASPDRPLAGTHWVGNGIGDENAIGFGPGADLVTIDFGEGPDGEVEVFTACREGMGRYRADETQIDLDPLSYGESTCPTAFADIDAAVRLTLDGKVAYEIEEANLTLRRAGRVLMFRAAE